MGSEGSVRVNLAVIKGRVSEGKRRQRGKEMGSGEGSEICMRWRGKERKGWREGREGGWEGRIRR